MDQESNFKIKVILGNAQELFDRQDQLFSNKNLLSVFHVEWIDILTWISEFWKIATLKQKALIQEGYDKVKPIAQRLNLPWPEELGK